MLGEDHSLINEFPKYKALIFQLCKSDKTFAEDCKNYNTHDKEIRELELNNEPITDQEMHQLKHVRAILKDSLYQRLIQAKNSA